MTTAAAWYLYNEDGAPAGHRIVEGDSPFPAVGDRVDGGGEWSEAEIVAFEELAHVCAMRRFKVIVRILC